MSKFQERMDKINSDPVRRADINELKHQIDLILALAQLREAVGMTQSELATGLGTSQENISRIEREIDVKFSTIRRIAKACGVELELNAILEDGERVSLLRPAAAATRGGTNAALTR